MIKKSVKFLFLMTLISYFISCSNSQRKWPNEESIKTINEINEMSSRYALIKPSMWEPGSPHVMAEHEAKKLLREIRGKMANKAEPIEVRVSGLAAIMSINEATKEEKEEMKELKIEANGLINDKFISNTTRYNLKKALETP